MTLTGTGPGQGVSGFIAQPTNPFDPLSGYPPSNPGAGSIRARRASPGSSRYGHGHVAPVTLSLYCIDIHTNTVPGIGYSSARGRTPRSPTSATSPGSSTATTQRRTSRRILPMWHDKAAAVQAAIWFFSDRYVLSTSDPLHNTVVAIADR